MKLNWKQYGEGDENLIILHGLFGMLDNWTTLAKRFSAHYKVFTIDLRNHGKSDHIPEMSYHLMALDLLEFMDQNQIYTANIIGHSMGGKAVMAFAEDFPERIERMVVVDIAPKRYEPKHSEIIDALCTLPIESISSRNEAEEYLEKRISNFGVRQFLLKNLARSANGFSWKMNLPVIVENYEAIIGEVSINKGFERPVLAIAGGNSNYIDQDDVEHFESHYPNFTFKTIENSGHWVHAEQPENFYNTVIDFLRKPLY